MIYARLLLTTISGNLLRLNVVNFLVFVRVFRFCSLVVFTKIVNVKK